MCKNGFLTLVGEIDTTPNEKRIDRDTVYELFNDVIESKVIRGDVRDITAMLGCSVMVGDLGDSIPMKKVADELLVITTTDGNYLVFAVLQNRKYYMVSGSKYSLISPENPIILIEIDDCYSFIGWVKSKLSQVFIVLDKFGLKELSLINLGSDKDVVIGVTR